MNVKTVGSLPVYFFENLLKYKEIIHFISTRQGGMSSGAYKSLNIGFHTGDDQKNVLKNRETIAKSMGIPLENFVSAKQVHGDRICVADSTDKGRGAIDYERAVDDTDGFVSNEPGVCVMIGVADCVPILLYDPKNKAIGVVHAGWRGSVKRIAIKAVGQLYAQFGSRPEDIVAGIGPSIGPCCYEVGQEVTDVLKILTGIRQYNVLVSVGKGKTHFNLWEFTKQELLRADLKEENIEVAGICTKDYADVFFSSRRANGVTGRFAAGIMLK